MRKYEITATRFLRHYTDASLLLEFVDFRHEVMPSDTVIPMRNGKMPKILMTGIRGQGNTPITDGAAAQAIIIIAGLYMLSGCIMIWLLKESGKISAVKPLTLW
jgi:hypothetical protein